MIISNSDLLSGCSITDAVGYDSNIFPLSGFLHARKRKRLHNIFNQIILSDVVLCKFSSLSLSWLGTLKSLT